MSDELKTFCSDLRDRLGWLAEEVLRLTEENERLKKENEALREEATLARLYRDLGLAEEEKIANGAELIPPEAITGILISLASLAVDSTFTPCIMPSRLMSV